MVTIREYRTGERDLLRAMALELHETLRPFDSCLAPGNDIIDEYLQYVLSTIEETNGAVLLADREGEPAGYLCLIGARQPEDTDLVPEPFAVVADLFVRSTCRGFGVGEQLMAAILGTYGVSAKPLWDADVGKELLPEETESVREPDRTRGVGQQDVGRPGSAVRRRLCRVSPRCEEGSTRNARLRAPAGEGVEGNDSSLRRWSDAPHGIPHRDRVWQVRPDTENCCPCGCHCLQGSVILNRWG
jgi:GNAT superfamily N-acetyltransferase